ncbi:MAG: beta strand repeat-containing protein, partial [Planctomycetales bacterium]
AFDDPDDDPVDIKVVRLNAFFFGATSFSSLDTSSEIELVELTFTTPASFSAATVITIEIVQPGSIVGGGGTQLDSVVQNLTVNPAPSVSIAGTIDGAEGATPTDGLFTVNQSATTGTNTVVNFSVTGAADDATDFNIATAGNVTYNAAANTGTVTIPAGMTSTTIPIVVLDGNTSVEATEDVSITLTGIASGDAVLGGGTNDSIDITDNDTATATFASTSVSGAENGNRTFDVTLNNPVDQELILDVTFTDVSATGNGTDYTSTAQQITFNAGSTTATGSIVVPISVDAIVEADETFTVNLAINGSQGDRSIVTSQTATGTITDDDSATASIRNGSNAAEPSTDGSFIVELTAESSTETVVQIAIDPSTTADSPDDGTITGTGLSLDLVTGMGTVTFAAGVTLRTINVNVTVDDIVEETETVILNLTGVTGDPQIMLDGVAADLTATVNVTDDDTAQVSIAGTNGEEGGSPEDGLFTVTQTAESSTDTVLTYMIEGTAVEETDYAALSGTVTIAAGQTSATIAIDVTDDAIVEGTENVSLTIAIASSDNDVTLGTATDSIDILDDDTATVTFVSLSTNIDEEATDPTVDVVALLTISASGSGTPMLSQSVTARIADTGTGNADNPSDYSTTAPDTVMFGAGSFTGVTQTVTDIVTVASDTLQEANETIELLLSITAGGLGGQVTSPVSGNTHTVTIIDDDTPSISVANSSSVLENSGSDLVYTFTRTGDANTLLTVNFSVSGGTAGSTEFTVNDSPTAVTFSGTTGTLTLGMGVETFDLSITPADDNVVELDETVLVNVEARTTGNVYNVGVLATGTGTITNDDSAVVSISSPSITEGGTLAFSVTIDNPVDVAVTADRATADGDATTADSDYTALASANQTLFAAGLTTAFTVNVDTGDDSTVELDEALSLILSNLAATGRSVTFNGAGSTVTGAGTITNDDSAVVSISSPSIT